jgi:hypothetical protein
MKTLTDAAKFEAKFVRTAKAIAKFAAGTDASREASAPLYRAIDCLDSSVRFIVPTAPDGWSSEQLACRIAFGRTRALHASIATARESAQANVRAARDAEIAELTAKIRERNASMGGYEKELALMARR